MENFLNNLITLGVKKTDKIILGVSGGIDSVIMLDLFAKAGFKNLIVAHLNHGVRKEADDDQDFVQNLAQKYGFKFETKKITPPKTGNLENELRNLRREFLLEVTDKYKAKYLALAHNKNDQVETFLMNLLRGSGPAGLAAMQETEGKIIRPLLNITRAEIEVYAKVNKLAWHEDLTNQDISYARNYLRHQVLPKLAKVNPDYLDNISKTTQIQNEIDQKLKIEAKKYLDVSVADLQRLDEPVLFEIFAMKYERVKGDRKELNFSHFQAFSSLISSVSGSQEIYLPSGISARRSYQSLEFLRKKEDNNISPEFDLKLKIGKTKINNWLFEAKRVNQFVDDPQKGTFFTDEETFKELRIRNWETGDKIEKEGIAGSKKLQDLFTDAKIDKDTRKSWPIIVSKNVVVWVPILAFSRDSKPKTKNIIKITVRKDEKTANEE